MSWTLIVLDAVFSIVAGLLVAWGYLWLCARRDEQQAMQNANIRARFDANRYAELTVDDPWVSQGYERCGTVVYDWQTSES